MKESGVKGLKGGLKGRLRMLKGWLRKECKGGMSKDTGILWLPLR